MQNILDGRFFLLNFMCCMFECYVWVQMICATKATSSVKITQHHCVCTALKCYETNCDKYLCLKSCYERHSFTATTRKSMRLLILLIYRKQVLHELSNSALKSKLTLFIHFVHTIHHKKMPVHFLSCACQIAYLRQLNVYGVRQILSDHTHLLPVNSA